MATRRGDAIARHLDTTPVDVRAAARRAPRGGQMMEQTHQLPLDFAEAPTEPMLPVARRTPAPEKRQTGELGEATSVAAKPERRRAAATHETRAELAATTYVAREPRKPTKVRQKFDELRAALADGWEIVQPIFARPLWSVVDDSATAFNFVLRRDGVSRLLTVPTGKPVERFIREQRLSVDYQR